MLDLDRKPESNVGQYPSASRWLIATLLALTATALGVWGYSEASRADDLAADKAVAETRAADLEADLVVAETQVTDLGADLVVAETQAADLEADLVAATTEVASLQAQLNQTRGEPEGWTVADLAAWEAAFESGEYEQVRALFTEDGIMTTAWKTTGLYHGNTSHLGTWGVDGSEFRRIATLHGGEDHTVLGPPIQVGTNTVAFGWKWSSGFSGTALLHLRDGKVVVAILNPSQAPIPFQVGS